MARVPTKEELRNHLTDNPVENWIVYAIGRIPDSRDPVDSGKPCTAQTVLTEVVTEVMEDPLVQDFDELFGSIRYCYWTSACLMSFRIYEVLCRMLVDRYGTTGSEGLKLHELVREVDAITASILGVDEDYADTSDEPEFDVLNHIRKLRNQGVHGRQSFGEEIALKVCGINIYLLLILHEDLFEIDEKGTFYTLDGEIFFKPNLRPAKEAT